MRKISLLLALLITAMNPIKAEADKYLYLSPGLSLSIDFSGNLIFSPKISVGIYQNKKFVNMTFGYVSTVTGEDYSYYYIEPQYGFLSDPSGVKKLQLYYGIGLGVAYLNSEKGNKFVLKNSLFGGFGLFLNTSLLINEAEKSDIGLQLVFPISLEKEYFNVDIQ